MSTYELYFPPAVPGRNPKNGRFQKGHVPFNKGVKGWMQNIPARSRRRIAKGWKNLQKYRPAHPENAGRARKKVVAVTCDGKFKIFDSVRAAAEWVGGRRENIGRCCRQNRSRAKLRKPWGQETDRVNTDHSYLGCRFYFFDDDIWWVKTGR